MRHGVRMSISPWVYGLASTSAGKGLRSALNQGMPESELPLGPAAESYRTRWEHLQQAIRGGEPIRPDRVVRVSRPLVDAAQADTLAQGRVDLTAEAKLLMTLPGGAGAFFTEMLSANPERKRLLGLSAPFHGSVQFETGGKQGRATLHLRGRDLPWPEELGGTWTSELGRTLTVSCRYAKWRDRRVRRLCRIQVWALDVVPAD